MMKWRMRLLFLMLIIATFPATIANAYVTQMELNNNAYLNFKQSDNALNDTYRQVLTEYQNDKAFTDKLVDAELAWITFRDAELEALYPEPSKQSYGSIYPLMLYGEKTKITSARARQLKEWLIGMPSRQNIGGVDDIQLAGTQQEINNVIVSKLKLADDTLNYEYRQILIMYKSDQLFIDKLTDAELAWLAFRDAEIEAINVVQNKQVRYGSLAPFACDIERTRLTWARVEQLKEWSEGLPEGRQWGSRRVNPDKHF
jgi:uncharacterized protein YecT (DUF1311 family)